MLGEQRGELSSLGGLGLTGCIAVFNAVFNAMHPNKLE